jgi:alpha-L-fucosidase 2
MVHELFTRCIEASKVLGVDEGFRARLEEAQAKLPPLRIGKHGQLQEWLEDYPEAMPNHRHTSHLAALYPFDQITRRGTPELAKAARVTIDRRLSQPNWEDVEWSRANMINFFARLGDGERAYQCVLGLIGKLSDTNLLTFSAAGIAGAQDNIFCVDGNTAGAAGIAEMLLQSHAGEIELLPALPKSWPTGSVRGICARGGFDVDIAWSDHKLVRAVIRARNGGICKVRYDGKTAEVATTPGRMLHFNGCLTSR